MNMNIHVNTVRDIKKGNPCKGGFLIKRAGSLSKVNMGGIMNKALLLLLIAALALFFFSSCGTTDPKKMTTIKISQVSAASTEEASVPVIVQSFNRISGLELHISYDTLQITYDNAIANALSNAVINESAGVVHLVWADYANQEISFDDGDTLMLLQFIDLAGESQLSFVGNNEVVNKTGQQLNVDFVDGSVSPPGN